MTNAKHAKDYEDSSGHFTLAVLRARLGFQAERELSHYTQKFEGSAQSQLKIF